MTVEAFEAFLGPLTARLDPVDAPAFPGDGTIHAAVILLLRPAAASEGGSVEGSRHDRVGDSRPFVAG